MEKNLGRDLAAYYTNVEHLRELFKEWIMAPTLPKRLLVIHGVGGVGKTSLLRMLRLHCKSSHVPVALASGDEDRSTVDILARWAQDLHADGVTLAAFTTTFNRYRQLQARVEQEASQTVKKLARGAAKTLAETAASTIPGLGPVLGKLGGMGAEALVGWLFSRGFKKPDVDLLLNSDEKLTADFLADLAKAAAKQRIVLMLDAFEQMRTLEDWTRGIAQHLTENAENTLLVIAGRAVPSWSRAWPTWMSYALVEELKPLSEEDMRELVRRYYVTLRGGEPDPQKVEAIIRFARGLPIVVTSAVQLWVQYGMENFQAVKPEVVADLVDRLLKGVPEELVPALEAAVVVRWFNRAILRAVMGRENVREVYKELRRFPFVRPRAEGLALHDAVREIMDENLRVHDPGRHRELHERAAMYFDKLIEQLRGLPGLNDEWQRLVLEKAYHLLHVDEDLGVNLVHQAFNQGLTYFRYQFCRMLLDELDRLPIKNRRSIHRLKFDKIRLKIAEFSPAYVSDKEFKELVEQASIDPETKWEVMLTYVDFLGFTRYYPTVRDERKRYAQESLKALQDIGKENSSAGCLVLSVLASLENDPTKREELSKRAIMISQQIGDRFCAYQPYIELGHTYLATGEYEKSEEMFRHAVIIAQELNNDALLANALNRLFHALMAQGRINEAEEVLKSAMQAARRLPPALGAGLDKVMYINRHFGMLYMTTGNYDKALHYLQESLETYRQRHSIGGRLRTLVLMANCFYHMGREDQIEKLAPEIEGLMPEASGEIGASWMIVKGHVFLDKALYSDSEDDLRHSIQLYCDGLRIALEQGNISALDEMLNRILWKVGQVIANGEEKTAKLILQELIKCWEIGEIANRRLTEIEFSLREKFSTPIKDAQILKRLKLALESVPDCKPNFWRGY